MEAVKQWAFAVCAAMAACGIAQMVLPKGGMEKVFRVTVSVFFLCCLLSPVVLRSPELRIQVEELTQEEIERRARRLTAEVEVQTGREAVGEVEKIIAQKLGQMGINYQGVTINMNINGQREGDGPTVTVILDNEYRPDHNRVQQALTEAVGLDVGLSYTGEEG